MADEDLEGGLRAGHERLGALVRAVVAETLESDADVAVGSRVDAAVRVVPLAVLADQQARSTRAADVWVKARHAVVVRDDEPRGMAMLARLIGATTTDPALTLVDQDHAETWLARCPPGTYGVVIDVMARERARHEDARLVTEPLIVDLRPTGTRRGRIEANGHGLAYAEIGAGDHGPRTRSDADGAFTLIGAGPRDPLWARVKGRVVHQGVRDPDDIRIIDSDADDSQADTTPDREAP